MSVGEGPRKYPQLEGDMGRMRNTIYLDRNVDIALRDWADRKG